MVGLSAAMGSDCCHTVTHNVPIQARHPLSWPRKVTCTTKEPPPPRRTAYLSTTRGPEVVVGDHRCLPDATMGVAWTVEKTGYPHLPGTQGRWEQHPTVTSAKVTPPRACKHGRGRG